MKNQTTGKRVSTLTPESSEAPRESLTGEMLYGGPADGSMSEEQLMLHDAALTGTGFMAGGKRVDPADIYLRAKTSSPELASLAAKYVNLSEEDVHFAVSQLGDTSGLVFDIRSLAASVLAQAEGTPRK